MNTHNIETVLRQFLTGDGYIAADDIPAICATIEADRKRQPGANTEVLQQLNDVLQHLENEAMKLEAAYGHNYKPYDAEKARAITEKLKTAIYAISTADRKRRGEDQEPFGYFRAEPFGWTDCAETDEGAIALYERPQVQDEPVGYIMPTALKQLKAGKLAIVGAVSQGCDVPIYTAPQPAEHKRSGEPVYLYRRRGRDDFVTCDKSRYDELSDKPDHFETRVLYTAPQPAEPVKRKRPYAQGTALGEFGVIPMCDQVDDEPVKVPSDEELEKAWDSFEAEMARHPTDDELEEFMAQFADEQGNIADDRHAEAARALLAHYGQDAQPAEPLIINAIFEICDGEAVGITEAKVKRYELQDDGSITVVIDYWPQPTEPSRSPTLHKSDSGAQNGIQATQPAEAREVEKNFPGINGEVTQTNRFSREIDK